MTDTTPLTTDSSDKSYYDNPFVRYLLRGHPQLADHHPHDSNFPNDLVTQYPEGSLFQLLCSRDLKVLEWMRDNMQLLKLDGWLLTAELLQQPIASKLPVEHFVIARVVEVSKKNGDKKDNHKKNNDKGNNDKKEEYWLVPIEEIKEKFNHGGYFVAHTGPSTFYEYEGKLITDLRPLWLLSKDFRDMLPMDGNQPNASKLALNQKQQLKLVSYETLSLSAVEECVRNPSVTLHAFNDRAPYQPAKTTFELLINYGRYDFIIAWLQCYPEEYPKLNSKYQKRVLHVISSEIHRQKRQFNAPVDGKKFIAVLITALLNDGKSLGQLWQSIGGHATGLNGRFSKKFQASIRHLIQVSPGLYNRLVRQLWEKVNVYFYALVGSPKALTMIQSGIDMLFIEEQLTAHKRKQLGLPDQLYKQHKHSDMTDEEAEEWWLTVCSKVDSVKSEMSKLAVASVSGEMQEAIQFLTNVIENNECPVAIAILAKKGITEDSLAELKLRYNEVLFENILASAQHSQKNRTKCPQSHRRSRSGRTTPISQLRTSSRGCLFDERISKGIAEPETLVPIRSLSC